MYQVSVRQHFDAAHYLRGYQGKCENVHGHRFEVVVYVKASQLNELGLAYDFVELKQHLAEIVRHFDHVCLNDIPPFNQINPSSENIAHTIFEKLQPGLGKEHLSLSSVEVWESPESCVSYSPSS